MPPGSPSEIKLARAEIAARLRARKEEIEQAALARIHSVADPSEIFDPGYVEGLRQALEASIGYGIDAVETGEERTPPVPPILLSQARLAARVGVGLDTVLRRYLAGFTLFGDFVLQEAEPWTGGDLGLHRLLQVQAAQFDHLVAAVSEQYMSERDEWLRSPHRRMAEKVKRLLAGELVDLSDLSYELDAWHLGTIAVGPGAEQALRELARRADRRLLLVPGGEDIAWAWLGGRRPLDPEGLPSWPGELPLALGEPGHGLAGWKLTHRQAKAVLPLAQKQGEGAVRYASAGLLASILQDDLLVASLRELYLVPLATEERDGGAALRQALRAYVRAEGKVSSAAADLGVNRHTVAKRLRTVEERLERPLGTCMAEVDMALRLAEAGA